MEISEVREKRDALEQTLMELIFEFIKETGVEISEVELSRPKQNMKVKDLEGRSFISGGFLSPRVDIKLEIPKFSI